MESILVSIYMNYRSIFGHFQSHICFNLVLRVVIVLVECNNMSAIQIYRKCKIYSSGRYSGWIDVRVGLTRCPTNKIGYLR